MLTLRNWEQEQQRFDLYTAYSLGVAPFDVLGKFAAEHQERKPRATGKRAVVTKTARQRA